MPRPTVASLVMSTVDERNITLISMVSDLLVEVEALREAVIRLSASAGRDPSSYRDAYRETALLSHDSAGPSTGVDKILALFYPDPSEADGRPLREIVMLRRLGMSQAELDAFQKEAKDLEVLT